MVITKRQTWSVILLSSYVVCSLILVEANKFRENDREKAIDDHLSGSLEPRKALKRRSIGAEYGLSARLFKRASGDEEGTADEKPHRSKKKKKPHHSSTTTTPAPVSSSSAPTSSTSTTSSPTKTPDKSTNKAAAAAAAATTTTTTTTGKPSSATTTTTTTTGKPVSTTLAPATTLKPTPRASDRKTIEEELKSQEVEATYMVAIKNALGAWEKWLEGNKVTLNRNFAIELYRQFRQIAKTYLRTTSRPSHHSFMTPEDYTIQAIVDPLRFYQRGRK